MREAIERDIQRVDESGGEEAKVDELPLLGGKATILGEEIVECAVHAEGSELLAVGAEGEVGASWTERAGELGERGGGLAEMALKGDLGGVLREGAVGEEEESIAVGSEIVVPGLLREVVEGRVCGLDDGLGMGRIPPAPGQDDGRHGSIVAVLLIAGSVESEVSIEPMRTFIVSNSRRAKSDCRYRAVVFG